MIYTKRHAQRATNIHEHLLTLYALVTGVRAKTVIELGVSTGQSTVALLEAVHATEGILVSVDINEHKNVRSMLAAYGLISRWQFRKVDDITFGLTWPKDKKADLIFIDTSHRYEHTKREIEVYEPILRQGGIMVFHDTVTFADGVMRPIKEFLDSHPSYAFENHKNCNGLGIMRKPAASQTV